MFLLALTTLAACELFRVQGFFEANPLRNGDFDRCQPVPPPSWSGGPAPVLRCVESFIRAPKAASHEAYLATNGMTCTRDAAQARCVAEQYGRYAVHGQDEYGEARRTLTVSTSLNGRCAITIDGSRRDNASVPWRADSDDRFDPAAISDIPCGTW